MWRRFAPKNGERIPQKVSSNRLFVPCWLIYIFLERKKQLTALLFFFASPPPLFISLFIHSSPEVFFHLFPSLKVYHHHHYHKIELARYSMTRSFHLSLSSIAIDSSSSLHPEGLFNGIFINLIIFYCIPWGFLS